ncbi:MAG: AI-2E family transporter [Luteimonas sp.]
MARQPAGIPYAGHCGRLGGAPIRPAGHHQRDHVEAYGHRRLAGATIGIADHRHGVDLVHAVIFLRDRRSILAFIASLSPLSRADTTRMFGDVDDTVHATVYGTLVVALVQGTLGGLMFWWLGLPAPLLWGVVMGLLAVVPVLGTFIVWIPAAFLLLLDGSGGKALILALWGGIVVSSIDNVLYPILVGRRLKMHTLLAFVSLVGGLVVFGSSGLILGPVTFAITRLLLEIWKRPRAPLLRS